MAAGIRPLSLGEILDRTVQLYRRNFLLLAGISTPPAVVMVAITGAAGIYFSSRVLTLAGTGQIGVAGPGAPFNPQQMLVLGLAAVAFVFVGLPLLLGVFSIAFAALNFAASQVHRGESATIRASYGYAFRHFWRHVGILFLQSLLAWVAPYFALTTVIIVGAIVAALVARSGAGNIIAPLFVVLTVVVLIAWLVVSVLVWLRFSLAYPASVAEGLSSWPSLKRSGQLSQGSRGRIFVMFLLVLILTVVLSLTLAIPLDIVLALASPRHAPGTPASFALLSFIQMGNLAVSFLVRVFVMPIYAIALVLFYIDQRTRMEGYDIEQLMIQAGWAELPLAPPSPPPIASEGTEA
jgi:hypothetical protein